ncbi:DUF5329 family protein [Pontibacter mangrovi]|uniref:DUF5329 domain-containing protein n=1 Tax=Pontibacter mangrovi TaxID=2589816 RepID=A0A501WE38_9BACT|nr:DUF5329 family protein [Pontibacter mangrovi]TPE45157.1 hypothetical protein FJM65_03710 [Pontibacter mangrovi]
MKSKMKAYVLMGFTLCAGLVSAEGAMAQANAVANTTMSTPKLSEEQKVERLIQLVAKMDGATFIRNGSDHTCREAAEHLESKWEKHRDEVKTAQGFIKELASHSGLTGEPYQIRFADGTVKTTQEVLLAELQELEQQ